MKYHELNVPSKQKATRVGRGIAAGKGKTAGRGTKGQNARSGGGVRPGFEGGQNPLMNRLPKMRGFRAVRPKAEVVYTGQLDSVAGNADNAKLAEKGLISSPFVRVKVVLNGEVTKKVALSTQSASQAAVKAIEKAGGSFKPVPTPQRSVTSAKKIAKKTEK